MVEVVSVEEIRNRLEQALPGARVQVRTFSGNDHFEAVVEKQKIYRLKTYSSVAADGVFSP